MGLDPEAADFEEQLAGIVRSDVTPDMVDQYRDMIRDGIAAGIPVQQANVCVDDFFPEKDWDVMAISGYMCRDPYTGASGVKEVEPGIYEVTVRQATPRGDKQITFRLRLMETIEQSRLVFSPLLNRLWVFIQLGSSFTF